MKTQKLKTKLVAKLVALLIIMGSFAGIFIGCSESEASSTSGRITVYTALENTQIEQYLAVFNARYPDIRVDVIRESTGIITSRLIAERNNPQADVIWGTAASSMMVLDGMDMLEPFAPEGLERILPMFRSQADVPTWVGITAFETAFVVNTVELERLGLSISDIQCYEDLLRPELEGHIVMPDPNSSGTGFLTVTAILQLFGEQAGWEFLDELDQNIVRYIASGSGPAAEAARGETVIGVSFGYAGIRQLNLGAPLEIVWPARGSGWDMEANALIARDEIHPAAKTFLNWAISDEAMALYNENFPIISTGQGRVVEGFGDNPVDQLIENDFYWVAENRDAILAEWARRFN